MLTPLMNVNYNCKKKQNCNAFFDQLENKINNAITKNGKIILLGDYNVKYSNNLEISKLGTVTPPYVSIQE